jgi:hypothetical protein
MEGSTMAKTNGKRDGALTAINVVVYVFLAASAAISFTHIVESGYKLGVGSQSWLIPIFVDGIAMVGKISMLPRFSEEFRKSGRRLFLIGGVLSLAANMYAGGNDGQRGFGALVVAGFLLLEHHATKATRKAASRKRKGQAWSAERRAAYEARRAEKAAAASKPATTRTWSPARRAAHESRRQLATA